MGFLIINIWHNLKRVHRAFQNKFFPIQFIMSATLELLFYDN